MSVGWFVCVAEGEGMFGMTRTIWRREREMEKVVVRMRIRMMGGNGCFLLKGMEGGESLNGVEGVVGEG